MNITERSLFIKQKAKEFGFLDCGISKAEFLEEEAPHLEQWLKQQHHGKLRYMENHFDKRLNPKLLMEGAKSILSFTYNYYPKKIQTQNSYKVAKYAYGEDYHLVIKDILKELLDELIQKIGDFSARIFTDSAPILEKAWAKKSGIGWIGKNSNLLSKKKGSFFFLAEIVCDLELNYDSEFTTDHCGKCTRCIDACPTEAIVHPKIIDAKKCISYATIELKEEIPTEFKNKMNDWIFGCDICQDVCPWNRFSMPHHQKRFQPSSQMLNFNKEEWENLQEESFQVLFKNSPLKRTKFIGLQRNISFIKEK